MQSPQTQQNAQVQKSALARIERWHQLEKLRARKAQIESVLLRIDSAVNESLQSAGKV